MKIWIALLLLSANAQCALMFNTASSNCYSGRVSGNTLNSTSAVTYYIWYSSRVGGATGHILSKGDADDAVDSLYTCAQGYGFRYYSTGTGLEYSRSGGTYVRSFDPFNVVVSYVYGQGNIIVVTNGALEGGQSWVGPGGTPNVLPANNNAVRLRIGSRTGTGTYMDGRIYSIACWNTNLTFRECQLLSASKLKNIPQQIRPNNLTYWYPFVSGPYGSSNLIERDFSANHNNITNEVTAALQVPDVLSYPPNE